MVGTENPNNDCFSDQCGDFIWLFYTRNFWNLTIKHRSVIEKTARADHLAVKQPSQVISNLDLLRFIYFDRIWEFCFNNITAIKCCDMILITWKHQSVQENSNVELTKVGTDKATAKHELTKITFSIICIYTMSFKMLLALVLCIV